MPTTVNGFGTHEAGAPLVRVTEPMPIDAFALLRNGRSLVGSLFGGIAETQEMLDLAAEHDVTADIELIDAQDSNTAYERMLASDVGYRFVIDGATFAPTQA
ncbi:hypothetical protein [Streptomyces sp. NPDC088794]|uniref:hypothetical protein n=1 Tax=Streptomyces sp. NPDC088794 TaxID=3365902 RepID=UPI00382EE923